MQINNIKEINKQKSFKKQASVLRNPGHFMKTISPIFDTLFYKLVTVVGVFQHNQWNFHGSVTAVFFLIGEKKKKAEGNNSTGLFVIPQLTAK